MSDISTGDAITIVRSEERLAVATRAVPARRAVLRKVIVSEERTITVTLRHEEFRLDYEPIDEGAEPLASAPGSDLELILHEERLAVSTMVVPVERIRIGVRQVVELRSITDDVLVEQIDVAGLPEPAADAPTAPRHRS